MTKCELKEHIFEKGNLTMVCTKCSIPYEEYASDLMDFIAEYRANKK
jgi:hypothetical protein